MVIKKLGLASLPLIAKRVVPNCLLCRYSQPSNLRPADDPVLDEPQAELSACSNRRTFDHLVHDLQQRSLSLIQAENIQPIASKPSDLLDPSTRPAGQSDGVPAMQRSRRKIRTDFSEDPEFSFERKRGKRHIMIALNQARSSRGGAAQAEKIVLRPELDLSIRWRNRLKKLLFTLPPPSAPTRDPSSSACPATETTQASAQDRQLTPIDDFVKTYLGPLVWSNTQVDVSLIYDPDQLVPKLTFWIRDQGADDSDEQTKTKEVAIDGSLSRSEILQLILTDQST